MTRRLARTADFDLTLQIKRDGFIATPREEQRSWLVNKAMGEFVADLNAAHHQAAEFIPGDSSPRVAVDRRLDDLDDQQIMEDWQIPLMRAMADLVTASQGDVLEIGFGRGISADLIQQAGVCSHTIVECNPNIVRRFVNWKAGYPGREIRILEDRWQDCTDQFEAYDGVFFHAYPLTDEEFLREAVQGVTFAGHFFQTAAAHLRDGGVFTYLTHEIDSLSRGQQRLLFEFFREVSLRPVPLSLPANSRDAWWANSMLVVKAVK